MMTVLEFPPALAGRVKAMDWHLLANTQSFTSPLSRATQSVELPGIIWTATLQMAPMREDRWRAWSAWLARLRGAAGRFYFTPPHAALPAGGAVAGSPTVVSQSSPVILVTQGWPPLSTVLRAGDLFSVATSAVTRELKILTQDVETNGEGHAHLFFEPPLRRPVPTGTAVVTSNPTCVMRLENDEQGRLALAAGPKAQSSLTIVEAIP